MYLFIYLFIYSTESNIIKKTKTIIIISKNEYIRLYSSSVYQTTSTNISEILYVVFKFTNWSAGLYVIR